MIRKREEGCNVLSVEIRTGAAMCKVQKKGKITVENHNKNRLSQYQFLSLNNQETKELEDKRKAC